MKKKTSRPASVTRYRFVGLVGRRAVVQAYTGRVLPPRDPDDEDDYFVLDKGQRSPLGDNWLWAFEVHATPESAVRGELLKLARVARKTRQELRRHERAHARLKALDAAGKVKVRT